jgi:hypothetical protein
METPCSRLITNETNLRLLNLKSNIKNMLCALFFSCFFKNKRKPSKTLDTYLLKLNASNDNYKARTKSSSIKSSKLNEILDYSLNFKLIKIVAFEKSKSNQCPKDWFNTQALTIGNTTSTMI